MGFQILNEQNEPILLKKLDQEAAEFWKVDHKDNFYVCPQSDDKMINSSLKRRNWFNHICYKIHEQNLNNWDMVLMAYIQPFIDLDDPEFNKLTYLEKINELFNDPYMKPYIDLILHWKSKKYTPKPVNDY